MRLIGFIAVVLIISSCAKTGGDKLDEYSSQYPISSKWLIACAAGDEDGFDGDTKDPISVFFYPQDGASDYRYYSTRNLEDDKDDFSNYKQWPKEVSEDVFNGYLKRFKINCSNEHWGIVTYRVGDSLRISDPIKITHETRQTETTESLLSINENGTTPEFSWQDGTHSENVIYFQVVSDLSDNLISGTYTTDLWWNFYDTSNVVINIKENPVPSLTAGEAYKFTLMSVSDDNWVNVTVTKEFSTL